MKLSYWERSLHFSDVDLCVIGAGIVGLWTAIIYKRKYPKGKIIVIDQLPIGSAATTRNAGFACFGSVSELLEDVNRYGEHQTIELIRRRWNGLNQMKASFDPRAIEYKTLGGSEVFDSHNDFEKYVESLIEINKLIAEAIGHSEVFEITPIESNLRFYQKKIFNPFEGQLDSGKLYHQLCRLCLKENIHILRGIRVTDMDIGGRPTVFTDQFEFKARKLSVCTNALSKSLLPEVSLSPSRNQVFITKPMTCDIPKGSFHYDRGYIYFRNVGHRILIGGGRNKFEQEQTDQFGQNEENLNYLLNIVKTKFAHCENVEIEDAWSGILSGGPSKIPIVKLISDNVGVAVRLGGMGVAIGAQVAQELVDLYSN